MPAQSSAVPAHELPTGQTPASPHPPSRPGPMPYPHGLAGTSAHSEFRVTPGQPLPVTQMSQPGRGTDPPPARPPSLALGKSPQGAWPAACTKGLRLVPSPGRGGLRGREMGVRVGAGECVTPTDCESKQVSLHQLNTASQSGRVGCGSLRTLVCQRVARTEPRVGLCSHRSCGAMREGGTLDVTVSSVYCTCVWV